MSVGPEETERAAGHRRERNGETSNNERDATALHHCNRLQKDCEENTGRRCFTEFMYHVESFLRRQILKASLKDAKFSYFAFEEQLLLLYTEKTSVDNC